MHAGADAQRVQARHHLVARDRRARVVDDAGVEVQGVSRAGRGRRGQPQRQAGQRRVVAAPDLAAARTAAEEEVAFAASLCDHPRDTLVAVRRSFENGEIREAFRTLRPRGERQPMRAFSFLDVEGEEEPGETVDLAALAKAGPKD